MNTEVVTLKEFINMLGFEPADLTPRIEELRKAEKGSIGSANSMYSRANYNLFKPYMKYVPSHGMFKELSGIGNMNLCIEHQDNYGEAYDRYIITIYSRDGLDIIKDPMIKFAIDESRKKIIPTYYENSIMQFYFHVFGFDYNENHPSELAFADSALHSILTNMPDCFLFE